MLPHGRYDLLVVADSDMRVGPDYLEAIAAAFDDPQVGAATCIYHGEPAHDNLASLLGAMSITDQFAPSALVATSLEPLTYCFGGTMAVRHAVLDEIKDDRPDEQLDPEALAVQRQAVEQVQRAIEGLPVDFREVVVLREIEGLSYKEIAAVIGVPIGTVMSRLARGRERLLALLAPDQTGGGAQ